MAPTCFSCFGSTSNQTREISLDAPFRLPAALPSWPPGGNFAKGTLDFSGLEVAHISTFTKVWSAPQGGEGNAGATFYNASSIPNGFSMLGCYARSNSKPLFGWVLVARDSSNIGVLVKPLDYKLLYTGNSPDVGNSYFWFPVAPDRYRPVGILVTTSQDKPSLDEIRCVHVDFVAECENDTWIWGGSGVDVYALRPKDRGVRSTGVQVGTFVVGTPPTDAPPMACLNNKHFTYSSMPNLDQITALARTYLPMIYFHPDDSYLPSSVNWFFANGALLYKAGGQAPSTVEPDGANLPQGGSNDGTFWLDLPADEPARSTVAKGNLGSAKVYLHAKPMLGATFTDLVIWVFYPFNGGGRAKLGAIKSISLGRIGEHVGDWEHVTLRVSNLTGELWKVYLSQHSAGTWLDPSEVEFEPGTNRPVVYSSLNGHANYAHPGLVLQGNEKIGVGIRNDTARGGGRLDAAERFDVVTVEHLDGEVVPPPWVDFYREWGPRITYDIGKELNKVLKFIPGKLKDDIKKVVNGLPSEVLGQEGPTGPKEKVNWAGDEK